MADDRELVARLAAIDATPRAGWVAELRADLDAAWQTEHPDSLDPLSLTTVTLVDNEPAPAGPSSRRRWKGLIVAAAVVFAVGVLVVLDRDDSPPADQPSPTIIVPPTITVPPMSPPRPLPATPGVQRLTPGTYFVDEVSGTPTPRIFATIGAGWWNPSMDQGWQLFKADTRFGKPGFDDLNPHQIGFMTYSNPVAVHSDACHWEGGYQPGPVDTLDGLVAALTGQHGWADITVPSDITVDGYVGKAFQRTAPADMSDCDTRIYRSRTSEDGLQPRPDFQSWEDADGEFDGVAEPAQLQTLWVLDIDGTIIVITTGVFPEASASARPDFAYDVLDSIRIDRR
jgi:hypothetical protein